MERSETSGKLAAALAAAQAELKNPALDKVNPHFKSRYASLAEVRNTILPVLSRHGLAVVQSLGSGDRGPVVSTVLLHSSGEWLACGALMLPVACHDPQGWGGAITYTRRYALQALAGVVAEEDDDAEQASRPAPQRHPAKAPPAGRPAVAEMVAGYEKRMVAAGLCKPGQLVAALVRDLGPKHGPDVSTWPGAAAGEVVAWCKAAEQRARSRHDPDEAAERAAIQSEGNGE